MKTIILITLASLTLNACGKKIGITPNKLSDTIGTSDLESDKTITPSSTDPVSNEDSPAHEAQTSENNEANNTPDYPLEDDGVMQGHTPGYPSENDQLTCTIPTDAKAIADLAEIDRIFLFNFLQKSENERRSIVNTIKQLLQNMQPLSSLERERFLKSLPLPLPSCKVINFLLSKSQESLDNNENDYDPELNPETELQYEDSGDVINWDEDFDDVLNWDDSL